MLGNIGWSSDALKAWAWGLGMQGIDYREWVDGEATIGTVVHLAISAELHGRAVDIAATGLSAEALDRATRAIAAWRAWRALTGIRLIASERSLVSRRWEYGGTLDVATDLDGARGILDLKTGRAYPEAVIQIVAYGALWTEHYPDEPIDEYHLLVIGKDDGSFHHHRWPRSALEPATQAWSHALGLHGVRRAIERALG